MHDVARLPPKDRRDLFRTAAQAMRSMLFGDVPDFATIMAGLAALEAEINASNHTPR